MKPHSEIQAYTCGRASFLVRHPVSRCTFASPSLPIAAADEHNTSMALPTSSLVLLSAHHIKTANFDLSNYIDAERPKSTSVLFAHSLMTKNVLCTYYLPQQRGSLRANPVRLLYELAALLEECGQSEIAGSWWNSPGFKTLRQCQAYHEHCKQSERRDASVTLIKM